jgi:hypothetical protein
LTDRIMDRLHVRRDFAGAAVAGEASDRRRGHVDGEQHRPHFIVQIARELGALFCLQCAQALVQPAVLRRGGGEPPAMRLKLSRRGASALAGHALRHSPQIVALPIWPNAADRVSSGRRARPTPA